MKTKKIKVYSFGELNQEAQTRAIEDNRYLNVEDQDWFDGVYEKWTEILEGMGINDPTFQFSGFYSQGDGASFTATDIDLWKFVKFNKLGRKYAKLKTGIKEELISAVIERTSHQHSHENSITAYISSDIEGHDDLVGELEKYLDDQVRELSIKLYKELENEYEYQTSDESIAEYLKDDTSREYKENGEEFNND